MKTQNESPSFGRTESGVMLIAQERHEQIHKHGWDVDNDADYGEKELVKAALYAINPKQFEWPFEWTAEFRDKIKKKNEIQRLTVAGALIAAEIDRLKNKRRRKR